MINTLEDLAKIAESCEMKISDIALQKQSALLEIPEKEVYAKMQKNLEVMLDSIKKGCKKNISSASGLTGGSAYKMQKQIDANQTVCGSLLSNAIKMALAVSEMNASMGKIVAAPTAGSCGILPAAIGALIQEKGVSKDIATKALFTAGQIGLIIANNASISGAEGGCQAECGTASAMAAAAIVEIEGGTPTMCINAVAIAIKCILGLVCDPVAGLVEVPCIKRNASGVTLAFTAAEMSLAGIKSAIPADEVVLAMKKVGCAIPQALRETADGGLATTPTGKKIQKDLFGNNSLSNCRSCKSCL
ncbi:MAG: L-serine ammonia-lyase, iron-sulfur-dependent, subunit alpha [Treponema sp.]|nr:MAG: L-serine ammonia-lyase, iron-sulfur-dependent, subunit alpha [Treponema sp.]